MHAAGWIPSGSLEQLVPHIQLTQQEKQTGVQTQASLALAHAACAYEDHTKVSEAVDSGS